MSITEVQAQDLELFVKRMNLTKTRAWLETAASSYTSKKISTLGEQQLELLSQPEVLEAPCLTWWRVAHGMDE